jgi:hypothetical protein
MRRGWKEYGDVVIVYSGEYLEFKSNKCCDCPTKCRDKTRYISKLFVNALSHPRIEYISFKYCRSFPAAENQAVCPD